MGLALFQDSLNNALAAQNQLNSNVNTGGGIIALTHFMIAGTTSPITFRVRVGGSGGGTILFNGNGASRLYGGALASSITITEIVS
jgi:predicted outer membrane repeat protein